MKLTILGCLLLLSGCAVSLSKSRQIENLLPQPSLDQSVEKSLATSYFSIGQWPEENWWEIFRSEQLNKLIAEALHTNPNLKEVEQKITFARQEALVEQSHLFPLIYFDWDNDWQYLSKNGLYRALNPKIPLSANLINLDFSFRYEFDFWGKYRHLFYAAIGEAKAKDAESREVELIVTTTLAGAYFALKTNMMRKNLYSRLYEIRKGIFALNDFLREKALRSKLIPLLSEENLLEAEQNLASIEEEIQKDIHLVNILRGQGPDTPLCIDQSLPSLPQKLVIPENLSLDLLARRPDLMAEIWRVKSLAENVGAAMADFFPNINLSAFIGLQSLLFPRLFQLSSATGGLEPAFSLPIFTAGAIGANVRAKKALFDEAIFRYNALVLKSASEVADRLVFAKAIFEQKEEQAQIVKSAQSRYELMKLRKQSGLDSLIDVYAIEEELVLKQLQDTTFLYSQYLAFIKLIKACGGGYYSPCIPLEAA